MTEQPERPDPAAPERPDPAAQTHVSSMGDERTVNNQMRHQYRVLTEVEKRQMQDLKDKGLELFQFIQALGGSRELSLALTKTEEAVMWATKHLTR